MLYRVTVRCWYVGPHKRPRREFVRVLVDEIDLDSAKARGVEFAEGNAACDRKWTNFEWWETSTVVLPKIIGNL